MKLYIIQYFLISMVLLLVNDWLKEVVLRIEILYMRQVGILYFVLYGNGKLMINSDMCFKIFGNIVVCIVVEKFKRKNIIVNKRSILY